MRSLDDVFRTRLLRAAIFLCAIALLLAPLAGRSSMVVQENAIAGSPSFESHASIQSHSARTLTIERDPFVAPAADRDQTQIPSSGVTGVVGMTVRQGDSMGYVVPGRSSESPAAVVVRAIVAGSNPSALIEDNGKPRVVQTGDLLDGGRILRIDRAGILLQNGRRLGIDESDR